MAIGYEDNTIQVVPGKPIPISGQTMFWWSSSVNITANSYATATITTPATGKKLIIVGIDVSCSASFITLFQLLIGGSVAHQMWYDIRAFASIIEGALEVGAGSALSVAIYNYDTAATRNFKYNILAYEINV